ncbi:carboxypeptidase N subunit 2 [Anabrus simplex]|uniref:carboxypeptidase N subunit 2 n=1 Tax=Anabrus simplex TaxID=316456 RepID=UPI0035A36C8D
MRLIVLVVLALVMFSSCCSLICPEGCRCTNVLDCARVQLHISELHVSGMNLSNTLASQTASPFKNRNALRTLNLTANGISAVTSQTFEPLINLKEVYLDSNNLRILDSNTFLNNNLLYLLTLNNNPFVSMPILTAPSLGWLELENCNLTEIPPHVFDNMTELFYLSLDNNRLHVLPQEQFQKLTKLSYLHIRHNLLTKFDALTFKYNRMLQVLYLENNPLILPENSAFLVSSSLLILDLSFCNITFLPRRVFTKLPLLRSLKLNSNSLKEISFEILAKLKELKVLDLRNNRINSVRTEEFLNLDFKNNLFVDLRNNPLKCSCSDVWCQTFTDECDVGNVSVKLPCSSDIMTSCDWIFIKEDDLRTEDVEGTYSNETLPLLPKEEQDPMEINAAYLTIGLGAIVAITMLLAITFATVRGCRRKEEPTVLDEEDLFMKPSIRWTAVGTAYADMSPSKV